MKKVKWKSGMSFLGFAICGLMLSLLILLITGIFVRQYTVRQCDIYVEQIARKLVVCESMEDAQEKAKELAETIDITGVENVEITVDYAVGYTADIWKKGGYIEITIRADLGSFLFEREDKYDRWMMRMIERSEVFQIDE